MTSTYYSISSSLFGALSGAAILLGLFVGSKKIDTRRDAFRVEKRAEQNKTPNSFTFAKKSSSVPKTSENTIKTDYDKALSYVGKSGRVRLV